MCPIILGPAVTQLHKHLESLCLHANVSWSLPHMLTCHCPKHLAKSNISGVGKYILSVMGATCQGGWLQGDVKKLGTVLPYTAATLENYHRLCHFPRWRRHDVEYGIELMNNVCAKLFKWKIVELLHPKSKIPLSHPDGKLRQKQEDLTSDFWPERELMNFSSIRLVCFFFFFFLHTFPNTGHNSWHRVRVRQTSTHSFMNISDSVCYHQRFSKTVVKLI